MMVVLTFNVGAFTYFNTLKCSYASLHPSKAGSYKQPLRRRVVFSKSIVFDQTYNFLNDDLLSKKQSGFRHLHSALTAMLDATDQWYTNMDNAWPN